ncbi:PREDICTED: uncharacterized protein LOC109341548 isoform X1 [Lupinus angustifolius]|uniref:uncharacterized protein LOC109341548 isoform X1 n=1 Tax=Lupinus angustifolius TaxID=3871 RepID=UPI00092F367E|nr:PREDICTED: uncharacterized protein LOC109341548 isoform X1 [Lupinus angustifolius]
MYRNMQENGTHLPMYQLLEGNTNVNDQELCSICSPKRSTRTTLRVSKYESRIVKQELHLLENSKGFSQTSEETDYDLNQEPESNEEDCRMIKFHKFSLSFRTPQISITHGESGQEIMHFSSSAPDHNHSLDSSFLSSSAKNYLNLDLTI